MQLQLPFIYSKLNKESDDLKFTPPGEAYKYESTLKLLVQSNFYRNVIFPLR